MKLVVFSDTHGSIETMCSVIEKEQPDAVIHLGDHLRDVNVLRRLFPTLHVDAVPGNCDGFTGMPDTIVKTYDGVKLFMTHGHCYAVKSSLMRACYAAREAEADVLLYGHTHIPFCQQQGELWVMNPGACQDRRAAEYGVIEIENGKVHCRCENRN